jgi:hypothetical protein
MKAILFRGVWSTVIGVLTLSVVVAPLTAQGGNVLVAGSAQPEVSIGVACDSARFLVAVQGNATTLGAAGACFVDPSGVVGPTVTTGRSGGAPLVAFGGGQYLLTWDDDSTWPNDNIYAMFVQPDGSHVLPFPVCVDSVQKYATGVTFAAGQFLVVYARGNTLLARQVSPTGVVGSELVLTNSFYATMSATNVATVGADSLVAWVDDANRSEVNARIVYSTGTLGAEFTVDASAAASNDMVTVASNGSSYVVAYSDEVGAAGSLDSDLFTQAVSATGTLVGAPHVVCDSPGRQTGPFLAWGGTNYLITWTDMRNDANMNSQCDAGEATCWDIYGRYLASDGASLGAEWAIVERNDDQFASPVAFGAGKYLMAWTDGAMASNGGDVYALLVPGIPFATLYGTAKVNSLGCAPQITFAGVPSVSGPDPFTLRASNMLNNETGLFFYSLSGSNSVPFKGGTLCARSPLQRTPLASSGGNPAPSDCSGVLAFDFNAWVRSGSDSRLGAGQSVWGQFWSHDLQASFHVGLTAGVGFVLGP